MEEPPAVGRIDERVVDLLTESAGRIAFNGLRRTLGAHPESLARALRRLERDGVVVHDANGYSLDPRVVPRDATPFAAERASLRTVGTFALPHGTDRESFLGSLAGRWFGDLRWVGMYEAPGDPWMAWSIGGRAPEVFLTITEGDLRVLVAPTTATERTSEVESAAQKLLALALRSLPSWRSAPTRIRAFAAGGSHSLLDN